MDRIEQIKWDLKYWKNFFQWCDRRSIVLKGREAYKRAVKDLRKELRSLNKLMGRA